MRLVLGLAAACLPLLAAPVFANCADDVQTSMARFAEARPVRISSTIESKDVVTNVAIEMVRGGMHGRWEEGGAVSEFTLLGDRAWSKESGNWIELPAEKTAAFAAAAKSETSMTFEGIRDCEYLGIDSHTGLQSYRLSFFDNGTKVRASLQAHPELKLPVALQIWSTGAEKSTTIGQFTYSADITVEAPIDGAAR